MTKTILAAIAALSLGLAPALAAEGNGDPFPNNVGTIPSHVYGPLTQAADTGSNAYPDVRGRPGSDLPSLAGDLLPSNGSEGPVQTANSLPSRFEEGTVYYAQARQVQSWMLAHQGAAPTYAAAPSSGARGG